MSTAKLEREMAARGEGCLGKAKDDEPVFILRAQDKFAPKLIEMWTVLAWAGNDTDKIKEARALAHQMRAWQAVNGCKAPD